MSELFIKPYLDEDVDVRVAAVVRGRGFEAMTCREAKRLGRADDEQLAYSTEAGMALLTHNRPHFEILARQYIQTGQSHAGIIIAVRHPYYDVARRLLVLMNKVTADEMNNQLLYI